LKGYSIVWVDDYLADYHLIVRKVF